MNVIKVNFHIKIYFIYICFFILHLSRTILNKYIFNITINFENIKINYSNLFNYVNF